MSASSYECYFTRDRHSSANQVPYMDEEEKHQQLSSYEGNLPDQRVIGENPTDEGKERHSSQSDQDHKIYDSKRNVNNEAPESTVMAVKTSVPGARTASICNEDRPRQVPWPGQALQMYKKIAKLQHKFFGVHTRLNYERDALRPKSRNVNEALSKLGQVLEQFFVHGIPASEDQLWKNAHDQFTSSQQSFEDQMQLMDNLEKRLGRLLYKLAKMEPEFLQVVDAYFKGDHQNPDDASTADSSNSRSPSLVLNPLEQQYYDKRGDVRLLRERLINRKADFQVLPDEKAVSLASTSGDNILQHTAFREEMKIEQETMLKELHIAEQEMVSLWNQCQDAKFDVGELDMERNLAARISPQSADPEPEELESVKFSVPPFLPNNQHGLLPQFLREITWSKRHEPFMPYIESLVKYAGKQQYIEDWVGNIPMGKPAPPEPVEFEHAISSPKSEPDWAYLHWISDDAGLATDYVMVDNEDEVAPNGAALEKGEPGFVQKIFRRARSDGALDANSGDIPKPYNRGSRQMYRRPDLT